MLLNLCSNHNIIKMENVAIKGRGGKCDCYISSVTSVNLKKAGMASRNIVIKKQYTLF